MECVVELSQGNADDKLCPLLCRGSERGIAFQVLVRFYLTDFLRKMAENPIKSDLNTCNRIFIPAVFKA